MAMVLTSVTAIAELNGDGFYRVQNAVTKRYAYLLDDKGSFDPATSSADVNALHLYSAFLKASSDPSTVFYVSKANGTGSKYDHNVSGQGTSIYDFLSTYLKIRESKKYDGENAYFAYATKSGFTKYLGDIRSNPDDEKGLASVDAKGDSRLWYIHPLDADGAESYFGISPTVTAGGKYYHPYFGSFPLAPKSAGMRFYVISKVDPTFGVVVMREVSGTVPGGVAVIAECANPLATDNRCDVAYAQSYGDCSGNLLKGVYFDNDMKTHYNRTPFDRKSMRCLTSVEGKLVFAKADYDFVPRNMAYLQLSGDAQTSVDTYKVMTQTEYDSYIASLSSLNPDGYYRMRNVATGRYAYMADDKGSIASSDVDAIHLFSESPRASTDPSAVFHMEKPADASDVIERNLSAQGTDIKSVFGSYLKILPAEEKNGLQSYYAFSNAGGVSRYLGDAVPAGAEKGDASTDAVGDNRLWSFAGVSHEYESDNYFGIAPSLTSGGRYFYPFYADFDFTAYSAGMTFYSVSRIDPDPEVMVLSELSGVVPAGTPVIVECSNPLATDNRLRIGASGNYADVQGNLLSGVYFENGDAGHVNRKAYDRSSMRSLAVVDGKLVFTPADTQFVTRNQAYLTLSGADQKAVVTYRLLTEADYEKEVAEITDVDNGYYRMQNASTKRFARLVDNKGNVAGLKPDVNSLQLMNDILHVQSDPASVFSLVSGPASGSAVDRDLVAQGTSFSKIFGSYVKVLPAGETDGRNAYNVYVTKNGEKKYFADAAGDNGGMTAGDLGANGAWYLNEVGNGNDDFFGIAPSLTANGKYYHPFVADFPVSAISEGVRFHIISRIETNKKVLIIKEIEGVVPAGTPVIVECA